MVRKAKLDEFDAPEIERIDPAPSEEVPEEAPEHLETADQPHRRTRLIDLFLLRR